MNQTYKMTYKFNAMHQIKTGKPHSHTFIVIIYIVMDLEQQKEHASFMNYEARIKTYFSQYKQKFINEMDAFQNVVPTIERMGVIFFQNLSEELLSGGYRLQRLEIGDCPTRTFAIVNEEMI